MDLSSDLISQFVKVTNDNNKPLEDQTHNGTIVEYDGKKYVRLDGSDRLTPIASTVVTKPDERVTVVIKNHTATVTGNLSSPAARNDDVEDAIDQISEFEIIIANKVDVDQLNAEIAKIDQLQADNVVIRNTLTAYKADIDTIAADNVTINEKLTAAEAEIDDLKVTKIDAEVADLKYAEIEELNALSGEFYDLKSTYGEFVDLTTDRFTAVDANIENLEATKLSAKDIEGKYANIDFSNIGEAAIKKIFADSGLIRDLVVGDGTITGELIGVTIKGDLIEGNTIVADKLVVKGENGLYYKLNTDGITTEAEQTDYNSLNGQIIMANSITASKIDVKDLVAFDATIGGFKITEDSIYSGVKESVNNTTRGIYMDNDGQIVFGDASNYIKYYKDTDGNYKLAIVAKEIILGTSGKSVEEAIDELDTKNQELEEHLDARITTAEGKIQTQATEISTHDMKISTLEQDVNGFSFSLETLEKDAIVSTVEQFYQSTSATSLAGGSWSSTQPTWTDGKYIWRRTLVTYGDGSTDYTPSSTGVCITGNTGAKGADGQMLYATCGTAAGTAAKVATLEGGSLTLTKGAIVTVKFTYANSVSSPTLNVASTGAKSIRLNGSTLTSSAYYWVAGAVVTFVYDGSYWNISDAAALSKANDAAKTATNFMSYDSTNGLLIGNKSSGSWSGYRTQITSSAFNILDASGSTLASYGTNTIYLGKNSKSSTIDLCNGSATMTVTTLPNTNPTTGEETTWDFFSTISEALFYGAYADDDSRLSTIEIAPNDVYMVSNRYSDSGSLESSATFRFISDFINIETDGLIWANAKTLSFDAEDAFMSQVGGYVSFTTPRFRVSGDMYVEGNLNVSTGQISGQSTGSSWFRGRDYALLKSTNGTGTSAYYPVIDAKCNSGDWSIGTLGDSLYFVYTTDSNYSDGTNNTKKITMRYDGSITSDYYIEAPYFGENSFWNNGSCIYYRGNEISVESKGGIWLRPYWANATQNPNSYEFILGMVNSSYGPCLRPASNGTCTLGANGYGVKYIYATNTGIQSTSDARLKENVSDDFSKLEMLFSMLKPVTYVYKHLADDDDIRIGFIAQDVWSALETCGYDPRRFAAIHAEEVDSESDLKEYIDTDETYYLNYTEFTALNTHMIQKQQETINKQQNKINDLESRLKTLEALLGVA